MPLIGWVVPCSNSSASWASLDHCTCGLVVLLGSVQPPVETNVWDWKLPNGWKPPSTASGSCGSKADMRRTQTVSVTYQTHQLRTRYLCICLWLFSPASQIPWAPVYSLLLGQNLEFSQINLGSIEQTTCVSYCMELSSLALTKL